MEEGLPVVRVISSTKVPVPVSPQERTIPVGIYELTKDSVKLYYASMGIKDVE